ncbi:hypothetical protein D3C74_263730 [compost metagenome]
MFLPDELITLPADLGPQRFVVRMQIEVKLSQEIPFRHSRIMNTRSEAKGPQIGVVGS